MTLTATGKKKGLRMQKKMKVKKVVQDTKTKQLKTLNPEIFHTSND